MRQKSHFQIGIWQGINKYKKNIPFRRYFTDFMATHWRTIPIGISGHWQLNCNQFQLLLCILGRQDFCGFSSEYFIFPPSLNLNEYFDNSFAIRNIWVCMGHSGCTVPLRRWDYVLLSQLYPRQRDVI